MGRVLQESRKFMILKLVKESAFIPSCKAGCERDELGHGDHRTIDSVGTWVEFDVTNQINEASRGR
jgi:hypothetical protein